MPHANLLYNTIASIYAKMTWKALATVLVELKFSRFQAKDNMITLSNKMYFQNQRFDFIGITTKLTEKRILSKYFKSIVATIISQRNN